MPPPLPFEAPKTSHLSHEWHASSIIKIKEELLKEEEDLNVILEDNYLKFSSYYEKLINTTTIFNNLLAQHLSKILLGDKELEESISIRKMKDKLNTKLSILKEKENYSKYLSTALLPLASYWAQLPDYEKFPQSLDIASPDKKVIEVMISKKSLAFLEEISHLPIQVIKDSLIVYLSIFKKSFKVQISKMNHLTCQIYNDSLYFSYFLGEDLTFLIKDDLSTMFRREKEFLIKKYFNDNILYSVVRLGGFIDEGGISGLGKIIEDSLKYIESFMEGIRIMGEEIYCPMVGEELVGGLMLRWLLKELMGEGCRIEFMGNALSSLGPRLINPLIEKIITIFPLEECWGPLLKERMAILDGGIRRISGMTLGQCCNAYRRDEFENILSNQQLSMICRSFYPSNDLRDAFMEELEID